MKEKEEASSEKSSKKTDSGTISMTYAQVNSFNFRDGCQKLGGHPTDVKTAYWLKRIITELDRQRKKISEAYKNFLEEQKLPENATEDQIEAFGKAQDEFGEQTFTIEFSPVDVRKLDGLKLTAAEADAVEPLLHFPEE